MSSPLGWSPEDVSGLSNQNICVIGLPINLPHLLLFVQHGWGSTVITNPTWRKTLNHFKTRLVFLIKAPSIFISQGIIVQMCVSKVIKSELLSIIKWKLKMEEGHIGTIWLPSQWTHELASGQFYKGSCLIFHKVNRPLFGGIVMLKA